MSELLTGHSFFYIYTFEVYDYDSRIYSLQQDVVPEKRKERAASSVEASKRYGKLKTDREVAQYNSIDEMRKRQFYSTKVKIYKTKRKFMTRECSYEESEDGKTEKIKCNIYLSQVLKPAPKDAPKIF